MSEDKKIYISPEEVRDIDRFASEKLGIDTAILMENAALKVIGNMDMTKESFIIIAGTGNNGGDALAVARHLYAMDKKITVFVAGNTESSSELFELQKKMLSNMKIKLNYISDESDIGLLEEKVSRADITVEGIFGTGISRQLSKKYIQIINCINENAEIIVSIDIPSGMDGNTGEIYGACVKADLTVTFIYEKLAFNNPETLFYTGKITVENIGLPRGVLEKEVLRSKY